MKRISAAYRRNAAKANKGREPQLARGVLNACNVPIPANFHALSSTQVESLLMWADHYRYRAPKNANGSRARYFHALMQRRAEK